MGKKNIQPAWVNAFWAWHAKIAEILSASNINYLTIVTDETQRIIASINWNMCSYCAGPCGGCSQKDSDDVYACDDCPQGDLTECDICPYKQFRPRQF